VGRFDRQIQTALKLIKKNGQSVTWRQTPVTIADANAPWLDAPSTPVDYSPHICFLPIDREGQEYLASLGDTEAVTGSYYGLMGQVSFTPRINDIVIRDGVTLDIKSINLLSPNGQNILYTIIFNG